MTNGRIELWPLAQKARLFERFYRADLSGNIPGTGLGMSLVQEIMRLLYGRIDVDSEPGIGTRVALWFPLAGCHNFIDALSRGSHWTCPLLGDRPLHAGPALTRGPRQGRGGHEFHP